GRTREAARQEGAGERRRAHGRGGNRLGRPATPGRLSASQDGLMAWDLSCPDWWQRLQSGRSLVPDLPLTPDGDRAVRIFNKLRLADVPGTPTMEEAGGDWFRDIVRAMFGCID